MQRKLPSPTRFAAGLGAALGLACLSGIALAQSVDTGTVPFDTATPDATDPALDPLVTAKPAPAVSQKSAPKLPDLTPYPTYPPLTAEERAKRKRNGPARPLATTGLPPLLHAAGAPKASTRYDPDPAPPPTAAMLPANNPQKPVPQALGPYDPVGIDVGGLRLNPYAETDVGYETNPANIPAAAKGSAFSRGELGATFKSDWSRHELDGELRGGYTDFFSAHTSSHPDVAFTANGRIDAARDTDINLESHYVYTTQRTTATDLSGATASLASGTYAYGAAAGVTQRFGRTAVTLRGSLDRTAYDDVTLNDGTKLALHDNGYNTYELRGRVGYEMTPGFVPYVQASIDTRKHDAPTDTSGFARNSTGESLRFGTTYELSRIVTTDISLGYGHRVYQDARLKNLNGPLADASLAWQATPLTKLTLKGAMSQDETTLAGASGIVNSKVSGQVEHALLRNLTLTGLLSYQYSHYSCGCRNDSVLSGSIGANYNLTRELVLRGSYSYSRQSSSDPTARFADNIFMLGLKVQR